MLELNVSPEQLNNLRKQRDLLNSGVIEWEGGKSLTSKAVPLYARNEGNIFMYENTTDDKKTTSNTPEAVTVLETEASEENKVEKKEVLDEKIELKKKEESKQTSEEQKKIEGEWREFLNKNDNNQPDKFLADALMNKGITVEQYLKDPEFFKKNRLRYETQLPPEKLYALGKEWHAHFGLNENTKEEYRKKYQFINTMISAGLNPRGFAKQYNWAAYFDVTPPPVEFIDVVKNVVKSLVKEVIKDPKQNVYQGSQKFATSEIVENALPENYTAEQKQEAIAAFTSVLWEAANNNRQFQVKSDEKQTQMQLAKLGIAPDKIGEARTYDVEFKNRQEEKRKFINDKIQELSAKGVVVNETVMQILNNALLEDDERIAMAEHLIKRELTKQQAEALLKAHNVGNGKLGENGKQASVFNYTPTQILEKIKIQREQGFTRDEIRTLMKLGITGQNEGTGIPEGGEAEDNQENTANEPQDKQPEGEPPPAKGTSQLPNVTPEPTNEENEGKVDDRLEVEKEHDVLRSEGELTIPTVKFDNNIQRSIARDLERAGVNLDHNLIEIIKGINTQEEANLLFQRIKGGQEGGNDLEAYYGRIIESMDDLAEEMVDSDPENEWLWGEKGLYPLYEKVYQIDRKTGEPLLDEKGNKIPETILKRARRSKGKQGKALERVEMVRARPENIHKWIMHYMQYWHSDSPESDVDFYNKIAVRRVRGGQISLNQILSNYNIYMTTKIWNPDLEVVENGQKVKGGYEDHFVEDLYAQIFKDMFMYTKNRDAHLKYLGKMPEAKGISEFMASFHAYPSPITRGVWNQQSFMRWDYYSPQKFVSDVEKAGWDKSKLNDLSPKVKERQDGKVGAAKAFAESIYRNIMNLDERSEYSIQNLLGKDSLFFNKKKLLALRDRHAGVKGDRSEAIIDPDQYLDSRLIEEVLPDQNTFNEQLIEFRKAEIKAAKKKNKPVAKDEEIEKKFLKNFIFVPNPDYVEGQEKKNPDFDPSKPIGRLNVATIPPREIPVNIMAFRGFFNMFNLPQEDPRIEKLLRAVVAEEIGRVTRLYSKDENKAASSSSWFVENIDNNGKITYIPYDENRDKGKDVYIKDTDAALIAEQDAFFSLRWKGIAALNDPDGTGFDWQERALYAREYRLKGPTRKRNNESGKLHDINIYKATIIDFMRGTQTLTKKAVDVDQYGLELETKNGEIKYQQIKGEDEYLYKTPLDVVYEIVKGWQRYEKEQEKVRAEEIKKNLSTEDISNNEKQRTENRSELLRKLSGQLFFRRQTQEKYFGDHWVRGHKVLEENLLGGKEINFDKITNYDRFLKTGRVDVDMNAFRKEFEEYVKALRYGISTWKQLDLAQEIDIYDRDGNLVMVEDQDGNKRRPIAAQHFFGDEVLDHPQFWKDASPHAPGAKHVEVTNEKGEIERKWKYPHVIDPAEFNTGDGKVQLYILGALAGFGSQVLQHREMFTHDKYYSDAFLHAMYDALQSLPNNVIYKDEDKNDMAMRNIRWQTNAISRVDIDWLREHTGTGEWRMGLFAIFRAILAGALDATEESSKYIMKSIMSS